ncbi:hypothetical protein QBC37DRAFT_297237 [Rhypophila decipiens]|uniref:Peptidase M24 domain-containing protein n=1 Tax=Rhypophila decipiens TaxID=261697 RepID=A0AAN6XYQ8_9PEZI|nr:hypothetical protein QBC37DRAFT_297237 [Rhypophila decipiens]
MTVSSSPAFAAQDSSTSHPSVGNSADRAPKYFTLPSLREQVTIQDGWTKERRNRIPKILQKYGVDAWLISQKEYAEETVFWSLKSAKQFSARRRTTTLFIANPTKGSPSSYTWIDNTPKVWESVKEVLSRQKPASIAIDTHPQIAFSSGLHAGELDALKEGLGKEWASKLVSQPMIAVEYIATMPQSRAEWYGKLQSTAWAMISEAFSESVIEPGVTTTTDVEWWLRDKIQAMNYTTWFHPDVTIIDEHAWNLSSTSSSSSFLKEDELTTTEEKNVIHQGDLLHVDFGVTALGLNTDTQHLAYVLPLSQTDIPASLLAGLKKANRAQDIVLSHLQVRRTGNEILKDVLAQLKKENITAKVYSHPIGDWGHGAGALIGMTNLQDKVPVLGDLAVLKGMYYSIELLVEHYVEERDVMLRFPVEEDVRWVPSASSKEDDDDDKGTWVWAYGGRQEKFHIIQSRSGKEGDGGVAGFGSGDL